LDVAICGQSGMTATQTLYLKSVAKKRFFIKTTKMFAIKMLVIKILAILSLKIAEKKNLIVDANGKLLNINMLSNIDATLLTSTM